MLKSFLCPQFTNFLDKVVFVLDKAFKPSLMFTGRAWAYPSETPFRFSTLMLVSKGRSTGKVFHSGKFQSYPHTLD
jgi:hypothetical protein